MNDDLPDSVVIGIVALVVAVLVGCVFALVYRSEQTVMVSATLWERKIDIQAWTTVQESDWSIPEGGRYIRDYPAVHHHDRVWAGSHQECSGTGTKRRCSTVNDYRSVPVYRTKYDYWIERWVVVRTPESHGSDYNAFWPPSADDLHDPNPAVTEIGDERKGTAYSHYHLLVLTKDKVQYDVDASESDWRSMPVESYVILVLDIFKHPVQVKKGIRNNGNRRSASLSALSCRPRCEV